MAQPTERGLETLAEANVASFPSWTVPTLVEKRLYVRDFKKIVAFDLSHVVR